MQGSVQSYSQYSQRKKIDEQKNLETRKSHGLRRDQATLIISVGIFDNHRLLPELYWLR